MTEILVVGIFNPESTPPPIYLISMGSHELKLEATSGSETKNGSPPFEGLSETVNLGILDQ